VDLITAPDAKALNVDLVARPYHENIITKYKKKLNKKKLIKKNKTKHYYNK
jgi:hypothetical protein